MHRTCIYHRSYLRLSSCGLERRGASYHIYMFFQIIAAFLVVVHIAVPAKMTFSLAIDNIEKRLIIIDNQNVL